ncbi:MAG: hypothetical protein L0Y50_07050 [Beijerinckiaceae bacterium]|nr:hypothetical protein [Beijerinckiaceae bacterium]MCI0736015.1 hypothetical protein [Beijerinckiaceae bacterium]
MARSAANGSRTAELRAVPEGMLERLFSALAPVAGIIASREFLPRMQRGGFQDMARNVGSATTFRTRARRIG